MILFNGAGPPGCDSLGLPIAPHGLGKARFFSFPSLTKLLLERRRIYTSDCGAEVFTALR